MVIGFGFDVGGSLSLRPVLRGYRLYVSRFSPLSKTTLGSSYGRRVCVYIILLNLLIQESSYFLFYDLAHLSFAFISKDAASARAAAPTHIFYCFTGKINYWILSKSNCVRGWKKPFFPMPFPPCSISLWPIFTLESKATTCPTQPRFYIFLEKIYRNLFQFYFLLNFPKVY